MKMYTRLVQGFLALALLNGPALAASDLHLTLPATLAATQTQTLRLGPGALATLTFPDTVTDVTVTRGGLVDSRMIGNRVLLAGLTTHGSTPIVITTESGTYTWRVMMTGTQAGSIVSVTVMEPEVPQTATSTPAPAPATGTAVTVSLPASSPVSALLTVTEADAPRITYTTVRDGNTLILNYRVQAGAKAISLDERQLTVTGVTGPVVVKPNLGAMVVQPGTTRYGTVTLSAADAGSAPVISWPYRVGLASATLQQTLQVP